MENSNIQKQKNDLTEGPILSKLLRFAVPLMAANLVMQLYNIVDTIVIGYAVGDHGIAAVGISFPIMMLFNAVFMGVAMGGNIVISQMFGAKNYESLNKAANTTAFLAFALGFGITAIGLLCSRPLLELLNTPAEIIDDATVYLMIIFGGTLGNLFFNLSSGILRGLGDSRWPLYAMIFSTVLNIALDILFAIILGWGVAGVAWATLIAHFISGVILLYRFNTGNYGAKISLGQILKPDGEISRHIVRLGTPSSLQGLAMSLGGLIIMSFANNFGAAFVTANSVVQRVDGFAIMPLMGLGMAATTFSGQNIGANKPERANKGVYVAMGTIITISAVMGVLMWFAGSYIIKLFNVSDHVLEIGVRGIRWICFFYAFMGIDQCIAGAMRGAGATVRPLINSFAAQGSRILFIYLLAVAPLNKAIQAAVDAGRYATFELAKAAGVGLDGYMGIFYSMSIGMVLGAILNFLYFKFGNWRSKGIAQHRQMPSGASQSDKKPPSPGGM